MSPPGGQAVTQTSPVRVPIGARAHGPMGPATSTTATATTHNTYAAQLAHPGGQAIPVAQFRPADEPAPYDPPGLAGPGHGLAAGMPYTAPAAGYTAPPPGPPPVPHQNTYAAQLAHPGGPAVTHSGVGPRSELSPLRRARGDPPVNQRVMAFLPTPPNVVCAPPAYSGGPLNVVDHTNQVIQDRRARMGSPSPSRP